MLHIGTLKQPPRRWPLGWLLVLTLSTSLVLVVKASWIYNTDSQLILLLALLLLAILVALGTLGTLLLLRNLWSRQWSRASGWLLLAGTSLLGWWVSYRVGILALELPVSPDDPALSALLDWQRIFPFLAYSAV